MGNRLSEQLDSRKSGVNNRSSDDEIDHLKDDAEKIASKYLDQNDGQRTQHNTGSNRDEQWTRTVTARYQAHGFCDHYRRSRRTRKDDDPSKEADAADQRNKESSNCRKDRGYDKAKNKVIPF